MTKVRRTWMWALSRCGAAALVLGALPLAVVLQGKAEVPTVVKTSAGQLSGEAAPGYPVMTFKGVPFAAPPVGDLRWKAPIDFPGWEGIHKADHYSPACPQRQREGESFATSEDCLYLNIFTPTGSGAAKLPVMVWFFGGGFNVGRSSDPAFDAAGLASKGVVVVTINYRLGLLGFLTAPELDAVSPHHTSGNYGLMDQIQALRWVRRNIAAFGGDPGKVTIFGQSAGGGSVQFLTVSPLARGLFQRALSQSATMDPGDPLLWQGAMSYRLLKEAETNDWYYLRKAGVQSMAQLRAMSAEQIMALSPPPFPPFPPFFSPVLDGYVMPATFHDIYARHGQADVPFLQGTSAEDLSGTPTLKTTLAVYRKWSQEKFGPMADEFTRLYPASTDEEAGKAMNLALHDQNRISKITWAEKFAPGTHQNVYVYFWNRPTPGEESRGAYHGSEIPYIMGSLSDLHHPYTEYDRQVSTMMMGYWANFARSGDPNGPGLPPWPAFKPGDDRITMQLGDQPGPIEPATDPRTDFFRRWFATHPQM